MSIDLKVIYLKTNQGHGNARRISLKNCSNELVALMDADDISLKNRFENQLHSFIYNQNLDIVGGQITEFIGTPDNIIGKRVVPKEDSDIKKYMKKRCPMNQVTVMFKKSFYERAGGYIDWFCNEDYYLWIRMAEINGNFANVPEILVNVRVSNEMSSRRGGWKYFLSEAKLQSYMLKKKIILFPRYLYNIFFRFGGEIILTSNIRIKLFKLFRKTSDYVDILNSLKQKKIVLGEIPKFSVAMCVYNGDNPKWFDAALESIVNQTVKPSEIVLVVDGPISEEIQLVIDKYNKICKVGEKINEEIQSRIYDRSI